MKRKFNVQTSYTVLAIFGLALFLQAGCQQQAKMTAETAPAIKFDSLVYDFGEVGPSAKNIGEFKFTNAGKGMLEINKVARCCGVVTRLDKMQYAPGESGTIEVEWNSGPLESTMTKHIVVHSNDPNSPATTLTIKAKVVLKVDWEPKRLKLFLDESNAGCPDITIRSTDNRPFSVKGFKSTGESITAEYDPNVEKTEFVLKPKVDMEKLQENARGRIIISLTHPQGNTATILYSILPKYTVNPPLLIIFNAEPGKPIVRTISVLNNYHKDFEIESLTSENDVVALKILEQKKINYGYQLEVEITPPAASEGKTKFTDSLSVSIKGGEKLPIRCNGYYDKKKIRAAVQESEPE
jgi:hypothetical protein